MALTVTSIPSKQFANTDALTIPRLNLLGQPTFTITGTLGTSELADGAVTAAKATPGAFFYGAGTLAAGVYAVDLTPNMPAGYVTGAHIFFKADAANTTAIDINCDGLGAKDLAKLTDTGSGSLFEELDPGDIRAGQIVHAIYDGTRFQMLTAPAQELVEFVFTSGTNTYTGSTFPQTRAYGELTNRVLLVQIANTNTGASTLNIDALGALPITKYNDQPLVAGDLEGGQIVILVRDPVAGTSFQLLSELGQAPPDIAVVGEHRNLVITTNSGSPNSQVDITASEIVLRDSTGRNYLDSSVSLSGVSITASGANGLDSGAEAASTWYFIWCIRNPATATTAGLLSTSSTAPTMPSGYTYKGLIGAVRNDGSSNFIQFYQHNKYHAITATTISHSGSLVTGNGWQQFDSTAFGSIVPQTAKAVSASILAASAGSTCYVATLATAGGVGAGIGSTGLMSFATTPGEFFTIPLLSNGGSPYVRVISAGVIPQLNVSGFYL